MRRSLSCMLLALTLLAAAADAATMGVSRGHDLDALWSRAQKDYDLSQQDAVLLLESRTVEVGAEGDLSTTVHRVVWIGTDPGLDSHADLRIPWNSDRCTLDVHLLRTWRDEQWWPSPHAVSPTAVVETLPYALGRAPDYAGMRETMLLHDGVELPCILETSYTITERGAAREGADGLFVLAQEEPAVLVEYRLYANDARHLSSHGAPEPVAQDDELLWRMEGVLRLHLPTTSDPSAYEPCLIWSTWEDAASLRGSILGPIEGAATIEGTLADTLATRLESALTPISRAQRVVDLLNEGVRRIDYDDSWWRGRPRPANRVWETAYGHDLDRATLALGMLRAAGLEARPWLLSSRHWVCEEPPASAFVDRLLVAISLGGGESLLFDPSLGVLLGPATLLGSTSTPVRPAVDSRLTLDLTLASYGEEGWKGHGMLIASGAFSPHARMIGAEDQTHDLLEDIAGSVLENASLQGFNLERLNPLTVDAGFAFTLKSNEPDELGRIPLVCGDPAGGLLDELPRDVHLEQETRQSPVYLRVPLGQRVRVRFGLDDLTLLRAPEPFELENDVGHFALRVERSDKELCIDRELVLKTNWIEPAQWPALRALLLEEKDPAHRTVIVERE